MTAGSNPADLTHQGRTLSIGVDTGASIWEQVEAFCCPVSVRTVDKVRYGQANVKENDAHVHHLKRPSTRGLITLQGLRDGLTRVIRMAERRGLRLANLDYGALKCRSGGGSAKVRPSRIIFSRSSIRRSMAARAWPGGARV